MALAGCHFDPIGTTQQGCDPRHPTIHTAAVVNRPIAVGAIIDVLADATHGDPAVHEAISVTSSNDSVLHVHATTDAVIQVDAVGAGTAELILDRANGTELGRTSFTVVMPTSYELVSKLALVAGASESAAIVATPHIALGESPEFFVRALSGPDVLQLGGVFLMPDIGDATPVDRIDVDPIATATLRVDTAGPGFSELTFPKAGFSSGPTGVPPAAVVGVVESSIASIDLVTPDESTAAEAACLTIAALPRDSSGEIVHGAGVDFRSNESGVSLGHGEVIAYKYDPAVTTTVRATLNGKSTESGVHGAEFGAAKSAGSGCSVGHGGSHGTLAVVALAALVVTKRSRRRALA